MTLSDYRKKMAKELFTALSEKLSSYSYNDAVLDADVLLGFELKKNRAWILSKGETNLNEKEISRLEKLTAERKTGKPIAYLICKKEFFALPFYVDERVLIPKSDTEALVEAAFKFCNSTLKSFSRFETFTILDLCCGSGCIGISIIKNLFERYLKNTKLQNLPKVHLTLVDISADALTVSRINTEQLLKHEIQTGVLKLSFLETDLRKFKSNVSTYNCIVANPPYVPLVMVKELLKDGRSEPTLALNGGTDGLALFPSLADLISKKLKPDGAFFVEAGEYNIEKAVAIFEKAGFNNIIIHKDLNGDKRFFSSQ